MAQRLTIPEMHQRRIAFRTLMMSVVGASIAGGMDHAQAVKVLRKCGHSDRFIEAHLKVAGHSSEDIGRWMRKAL